MVCENSLTRRLACLDGLRGALALYVMLTHMAPFVAIPAQWQGLDRLFSHGMAGVDMFFVLSGLVIVRSLESFCYRPRPFLIARACRILPTFFVVFALALAVQPLARPFAALPWIGPDSVARDIWAEGWPPWWGVHVIAHLTMTHGLFPDGTMPFIWVSFLGAAWSLSTEWQFYGVVALTGDRLGRGAVAYRRLAVLLLLLAASGAVYAALAPNPAQFSRAFLANKAAYFALGVASAALIVAPGRRSAICFVAVLIAGLALSFAADGASRQVATAAALDALSRRADAAGGEAAAAARAGADVAARWYGSGAISYPLYLVNEPLQKLLGIALASACVGKRCGVRRIVDAARDRGADHRRVVAARRRGSTGATLGPRPRGARGAASRGAQSRRMNDQ